MKQKLLYLGLMAMAMSLNPVRGLGQIISEGFETGLPVNYTTGTVTLSSGVWEATDVSQGTTGINTGNFSCQLKSATNANIITPNIITGGVGTVAFYASCSTSSGSLQVNYSTDGGSNWIAATGSPFSLSTEVSQKTATINTTSSNVLIQFRRTSAVVYIDDIVIYAYSGPNFGDLVITEICGDAADGINNDNGFVEIFNITDRVLSLDDISVRYYNSNPGNPSSTQPLSGNILPKSFIIVTQDGASFLTQYGISADYSAGGTFFFNGGIDGVDIYHTSFGVLDEFNNNGASETQWGWNDASVYERVCSGNGTFEANWQEYDGGTGTPKSLLSVLWNWSINNDWNTSGNWNEIIPGAFQNATIPAGKTAEVAYTAQANSNNLTIEGTLTLKSDGDGTGSLIVNGTATGNITAERFIGAANWSTGSDGWHLLSSPVATQAISGVWTPDGASSNDYDFYAWNEANNIWVNFKNTTTSPTWAETNGNSNFTVGRGYVVAYQAESTNTFVGVPNVDDVVVSTLTRTTASYTDPNDAGFNVIGNPFPSAIKWNDGNWTLNNISTTAKLWNSASKSYNDLGANDIIPANNGFVVQLTTGTTGSITIPKLARTHSSTNWQKSKDQNRIRLIAREANNNSAQSSNIVLNTSANGNFDPQYDAVFLGGYAPLFYSIKDEKHLSTYAISAIADDATITYGFVSNGATEYEIELLENIENQSVFITDLKANKTQKLSENPVYAFTSEDGDSPNRFLLHFGVVGLGEQDQAPSLNAYVYDNRLYVNSTLDQPQLAVYDLHGRLVMQQQLSSNGLSTLPLNLPKGIYVLCAHNSQQARNLKINIQ